MERDVVLSSSLIKTLLFSSASEAHHHALPDLTSASQSKLTFCVMRHCQGSARTEQLHHIHHRFLNSRTFWLWGLHLKPMGDLWGVSKMARACSKFLFLMLCSLAADVIFLYLVMDLVSLQTFYWPVAVRNLDGEVSVVENWYVDFGGSYVKGVDIISFHVRLLKMFIFGSILFNYQLCFPSVERSAHSSPRFPSVCEAEGEPAGTPLIRAVSLHQSALHPHHHHRQMRPADARSTDVSAQVYLYTQTILTQGLFFALLAFHAELREAAIFQGSGINAAQTANRPDGLYCNLCIRFFALLGNRSWKYFWFGYCYTVKNHLKLLLFYFNLYVLLKYCKNVKITRKKPANLQQKWGGIS